MKPSECKRFLENLTRLDGARRKWIAVYPETGFPRLLFTRTPYGLPGHDRKPRKMYVVDIDSESRSVSAYLWIEEDRSDPDRSKGIYRALADQIQALTREGQRRLDHGHWTLGKSENAGYWLGFSRGAPAEERDWPSCHRELLEDIEWLEKELGPLFERACSGRA